MDRLTVSRRRLTSWSVVSSQPHVHKFQTDARQMAYWLASSKPEQNNIPTHLRIINYCNIHFNSIIYKIGFSFDLLLQDIPNNALFYVKIILKNSTQKRR
jgi:hypothetical protein